MAGQDQRVMIAGLSQQLNQAEQAAQKFFEESQLLRRQVSSLKELNIMVQLVCAVESGDAETKLDPSEIVDRADELLNTLNSYFRQKVEQAQAEAEAAKEAEEAKPQVDGDAKLVNQTPEVQAEGAD